MKKIVYISITYFVLHLIFSFISLPFMVSFGSGVNLKKIVLVFTNFPMSYNNNVSDLMFILNFLINSLFWSFILFLILLSYKFLKKNKSYPNR